MPERPSTDLGPLMHYIGVLYSFDEHKYPPLRDVAFGPKQTAFAINHSFKHLTESVGKLAAQCESADHGGEMSGERLRDIVASLTISSLNLANVLDMRAEELLERILKKLHDNPANVPRRNKQDVADRVLGRILDEPGDLSGRRV